MIPVVFGFGILVAILSALTRKAQAAAASPSPATAAASASTAASVQKIVDSGSPQKMMAAAAAAKDAGDHALADGLSKEAQNAAVVNAKAYPSPFPSVAGSEWSQFAINLRGKSAKTITPGYSLGLFGFGMRRLVDLGLASNPHKGTYKGKTVWLADWAPQLTPGPDTFLNTAQGQYNAFVKSMQLYAAQVHKEIPEAIGSTLDGKPVTLSGLLAVAHRAGWQGLKDWMGDPAVRAAHKQSGDIFNKENGLF